MAVCSIKLADKVIEIAETWTCDIHNRVMIKVNFAISKPDIVVITTNKYILIWSRRFIYDLNILKGISCNDNTRLVVDFDISIREMIEAMCLLIFLRSFVEFKQMSITVMRLDQIFMVLGDVEVISSINCLNILKLLVLVFSVKNSYNIRVNDTNNKSILAHVNKAHWEGCGIYLLEEIIILSCLIILENSGKV